MKNLQTFLAFFYIQKKVFDRYETKTYAWNARQNTLRLVSYNRRANPVKKNGQQVRQL